MFPSRCVKVPFLVHDVPFLVQKCYLSVTLFLINFLHIKYLQQPIIIKKENKNDYIILIYDFLQKGKEKFKCTKDRRKFKD